MTRKSHIKPPPIPEQEDPETTMRNQERQITMLINRVEQLTEQVDTYARDCRSAEARFESQELTLSSMKAANTRLLGYQDCAREVFRLMVEK